MCGSDVPHGWFAWCLEVFFSLICLGICPCRDCTWLSASVAVWVGAGLSGFLVPGSLFVWLSAGRQRGLSGFLVPGKWPERQRFVVSGPGQQCDSFLLPTSLLPTDGKAQRRWFESASC
jgi:hypothetical protein